MSPKEFHKDIRFRVPLRVAVRRVEICVAGVPRDIRGDVCRGFVAGPATKRCAAVRRGACQNMCVAWRRGTCEEMCIARRRGTCKEKCIAGRAGVCEERCITLRHLACAQMGVAGATRGLWEDVYHRTCSIFVCSLVNVVMYPSIHFAGFHLWVDP